MWQQSVYASGPHLVDALLALLAHGPPDSARLLVHIYERPQAHLSKW